MNKLFKKGLSWILTALMLLPMIVIPSSAATYGSWDFEEFTHGQTLTTSNGFQAVAPVQKVLVEEDNGFLRLPFACTDPTSASTYKTGTTNAGKYMQLNHSAFSTSKKTSIKVDLRLNGIQGTTPNAGLWLRRVNYTNASGTSTTENWFQLFNVNLLTGELVLASKYNPVKASTAKALTTTGWNTVEVIFNPANGSFAIYVNDALYATCTANVTGTNFVVGANVLMYAIDGTNKYDSFTAIDSLNDTYSNCNYMDADNFVIETAVEKPILDENFEDCTVGSTLSTADGITRAIPFSKVLEESNGNKFLRIPMASTQTGSLDDVKVAPTNRGNWLTFTHAAFSTTENTSISMDLRMNGVAGSNAPIIGIWLDRFSYTDVNGTTQTQRYVRLFDVNLLTGELATRDVNGTTTGAKGLIAGEWNNIEVIFDPKTGSFDIYINDALYKQCTSIVEGTNFVVGANQLWFCVCSSNNFANYTAASSLDSTYSNCNYMDGDNFKVVTTDRKVTGELYYSESFDSYTPGTSVALGTTPGATSTYEKDPTNANNVVVKVPFGAKPDSTEILMRMNGTVPVENGWYAVTRNATTNAVELEGWTVTEQDDGKYTITDGTTTYTGLELTTKETYYAYWGADGVIDQNWQLPNPEINYTKQTSVVFSADYYISADAYGRILAQLRHYGTNGTTTGFCDLFYINANNCTIAPKGGSTYAGINRGEWNNIMLEIDLISGVGKLYLNGEYLGNGTYPTNLTLQAGKLMVAKMNRKYSDYKKYDGYFMVDNVKLMSSTSSVSVDSDRLLYVEVGGKKIYNSTFNVPEGSTYKAVYLKDSDYTGMLATEASNSIRLSTSSGLRYATMVDTTLLAKLYAYLDAGDLADVEIGTLIAPTDYISGEFTVAALDKAGKKYITVATERDGYYSYDNSDATTHYVGSIVDFYASNIDRDFSGRGYAKITFRSGQVIYLYSAYTQSDDAMAVANRVITEKPEYYASLSAEKKEILDAYAAGEAVAVPEEVTHLRKLDRLNVLAIGDSLFHGDDVGYSEQWIARLAKRYDWNLTNIGRNGWTLGYDPDISTRGSIYNYLMNNADFKYGTTATTYYTYGNAQSLSAADVDLILLEGGNNDCGARLPMGTIDSRDEGTLMGATNLITDYLLETYPNATVVYVTSWHVSSTTTVDNVTYSRMDYAVNFMKQLYEAHYASNPRVTIVDAGNPEVTGINMADATFRAQYSIAANDSYHLNVEGMKIMESVMPKILADALFVCDAVDGMSTSHSYDANRKCTKCDYIDPASVKEEGITRVVCVGDSITAGGYWKNNMQGYLDESYEVLGFGVSGSTGLANGFDSYTIPKAYMYQPEHAESLRTNADVVVIMLGTNDTKGYNYSQITADGGEQYKKDIIALIDGYKAMGSNPQIFLGLPPTIFREWTENGINDEALDELLIDLLKEIATETGATVVDVHTATADASAHFSDGVHPSDDTGRALIAKAFADAILAANE
ncbi:MAG: SGNH/GDSL hydrolase family protein [Clostridia bacterium]|nr:SGNH/GDSL hydrolase family protein [Clostridia bacterium]